MKFYMPKEDAASTNLDADCFVYGPTGDKFVRHLCDRSETIMGLCVKYDTEEDLLRRYNRTMIFEHLDNLHGDFIYIPVKKNWMLQLTPPTTVRDDRWKRLMITKFCENIGKSVKNAEAEYYLDEAEWDVEAAGNIWREDDAWEKSAEAASIRKERAEAKLPTAFPTQETDSLVGRPTPPAGAAPVAAASIRRRGLQKRLEAGAELGSLKAS